MIRDISDRLEAQKALEKSRVQLQTHAEHLQRSIELDRKRIAREIHDELGQVLARLRLDLSWMTKRLETKSYNVLGGHIDSMQEMIDSTARAMQRIVGELRPTVLDDLGLTDAVKWLVDDFQKRTVDGLEIVSRIEEVKADADRSTAVFRICQEALTNAVEHANATRIEVSLKEEADHLILSVFDDGVGVTEEQVSGSTSFGLIGIRERARSCAGYADILGVPGGGTTIRVGIPLSTERGRR